MIDTQAEINNYNVLIMGGSGQYGGEISAGYLTVQTVVKNFVQNDHGGVIFTGWSVFTLLGIGATEYNDMIPVELSPDYGYQHTYTLLKHLPADPLFEGVGTVASTGYCEFPMGNMKSGAIAYAGLSPYVPYELPTVTTAAITTYNATSATMGGNVTAEGSAPVTSRGVVYSSTDNTPQLGESGVIADANGSGTGSFSESIGGLTAGLTYYVRAYATSSAGTGYGTTLSFTTIFCVNPTSGGSISENQIICYGNLPTALSSTEAPGGHTGTLEYKWQLSTTSASAGFNDIVNSNSATWSPDALTTTTWFRRLARVECITDDWASAAVSNTVTITVLPEFTAGSIETTGETICFNSDPGEIPNATAASGGDGTISYQWQSSTVSELTGFNNISGANDATYNPPSGLTESTWYRRTAKDGSCSSSPAKQPLKLNSQIHSPLVYNKNELQTIPQNTFSIANGKAGGASPNQNRSVALRYDDGVNFEGIGLTSGGTFQVSAYWPAATMEQYTGMALSQVEIFIQSLPSSCVIKIYGQGTINTPGNLLHEQVVTVSPTSWNLISLTNEVEITGEDMWIGYEVTHNAGLFPTGCDDGPALAGFGDMISIDGISWMNLAGIGFNYNWNIAATLIDGGEYTISAGVWKVDVLEDFTPGAIETTGENICYNGDPAQIGSTTSASGGDQVISYQWQSSTTGESTDFSDIIGADEASYNPPSGITETTWFLRMAKDGTCQTSFTASAGLWKVTVEPTPVAGTLTKTPNVMNVCENDIVSAVLTAGNGGNGIDELEFRTNNGTWSAWAAYTSGTNISTADLSGVEIRTRRAASTCSPSAYTTISWNVEATPIAGLLTKTPDVMNVCENDIVSAVLTAGNGGNGIDELEFRINYGTWSSWIIYVSGTNISTTDLSGIEIRTRRNATYCENSAYTTISWNVEATPVAGLLTKTPNVMNVCENDIVSAVLTAGNGGNGIDELEFRTNNGTWSAWAAYTSGTNISTADLSGVEIRTRRTASTCSSSAYTTIGWTVEATPIAGLLTKTPDVLNVCENDIVSAVLTAGNGGNGIDELEIRTNNGTWSAWAAYTSGANISTADLSGIEIRTRRTASYCENSAYTTIGWSVEATPVAGLLTKTPDVMNVCENDFVSAVLTAGNGGNGIDELEFRTNNGTWSAWAAYTSGTNISTADLSGVEIRTRRAASTCSPSEYTAIRWIVEATPVAGLLVKNPDINQVCIGEIVSATFTAGTGGNGADFLEYRTHDGSAWTEWNVYISGTSISTSDLTAVEIRTWRTATYCENSDYSVVSWIVNPLTVGGVVEGPEGVCIGTNSTTLVALGYTGSIVMWQTSTDYWATITNIQHTEPTLLVENLTVITQFRTVIQSGNCDQLYSVAAEIGVEDYPAPFITGEEVICDLNQIYEYSTEPEMVNYQWNITSGQILSGQGTSLITVQWNGSGEQTISVDYQTVFGCTMPEPFVMDIEILTPETPVITIEGFTLSSSASEGNQWYLNGNIIEGATSQTYEVTENGEYTCVVTLNDCSSEVSNTIAVLNVGSDPSLSFSMEVYPVPNNGMFTVKLFTTGSSAYSLTIYNALGSVVFSKESVMAHSGFSQMIDLTNSPAGIYTLVMQNENNKFVRKVVIN